MFFTIWYGVYNRLERALTYSSGGHHPAYLVQPDRKSFAPLTTSGPLIGVQEDKLFKEAQMAIPQGSSLHIFSDGVFEIADKQGRQLGLTEFLPLLNQPAVEGRSEPQRIYQTVRNTARPGPLDDDFSYLVIKFA
jgi:sigma-B regulation protein RsbU (phosphoserine phosphatase)